MWRDWTDERCDLRRISVQGMITAGGTVMRQCKPCWLNTFSMLRRQRVNKGFAVCVWVTVDIRHHSRHQNENCISSFSRPVSYWSDQNLTSLRLWTFTAADVMLCLLCKITDKSRHAKLKLLASAINIIIAQNPSWRCPNIPFRTPLHRSALYSFIWVLNICRIHVYV